MVLESTVPVVPVPPAKIKKTDNMQVELTNNSNWQSDISKIIDWDAFGIVFRDTYVIE